VIVSRGRRYVFVHIPKTGGTAMALALEARAMADDILIGDTPKARRRKRRLHGVTTAGRLWKHSTLADIDGLVGPDDLDGLFCFTLVRNPWDRMVSYYHWLRAQDFDHPAVRTARTHAFDGFLADRDVGAAIAANPARRYMTDARGRAHGHCLRLEHLQEDLAPLEAHLGFALEMPRANASERGADYRAYYTAATRARVAALCAEDIARFGYAF
jgi:hypothetical protein